MFFFKLFILIASILLTATYVMASTYLPIDDEVYNILYCLEAEGVIKSGLLTTKPLSRKEIARLLLEAERNAEGRSIFIQNLVRSLKEEFEDEINNARFVKPIDFLYGKYIYINSDNQTFNYNNEGDPYEKGSNLRAGLTSRGELGWLSFYVNPEVRYSVGNTDTDIILKRGYGVLSFLGLDLIVGKDSQWWGPGYNGALLISNNAEPMTMLRLTNPQPVLLPWVFRYLGPFRFNFFVTRLEKDRNDIPEPYLWGMRLNFKPHPCFEIGLERTAFLGGRGRSEDLKTWWKSFTGTEENKPEEASDQKVGFDVKLTLPFKWQPLQLYAEIVADDISSRLQIKGAYLAGIYLPRILNLDRIDFMAEYARTTHVAMYTHHIYTSGYTYKGMIIGHHMGTDSKDIFLKLSYLIPEQNGRVSISYDREEHNLSGAVREKTDEGSLKAHIRLKSGFEIKTSCSYGRIKNFGNIPAEDENIYTIFGLIGYNF